MSHSANKGCYKCTKSFPTLSFGDKPDYSGFDHENWMPRSHADFYNWAMKHRHAKTAKERQEIEKLHGVRYTVLLSLPYYDAIRFCIIDPMHNLLGSAKTFVKPWVHTLGTSSDHVLPLIQNEVDKFVTPSGFGRLPRKVESGFANFKAAQWKNWILIYSIVCFKSVLSPTQYLMWLVFVQACSLLCSRAITQDGIILADRLIHEYCCLFEEEFGKEQCYPNLHLHCHLKNCLFDFGPATAFWLFSFERMNGLLGSFHTSNHAVEIQLFRKFISTQHVSSTMWPDIELTSILKPLLNDIEGTKDITSSGGLYLHIVKPLEKASILAANDISKLLPPIKEKFFSVCELALINACFSSWFGEEFKRTLILHKESKSIVFNGDLYESYFSKHKNSSLVIIRDQNQSQEVKKYPCFIVGFVKCIVLLDTTESSATVSKEFILLIVVPLAEHHQRYFYSQPVKVWKMPESAFISNSSNYLFFSLSCILCVCAYFVFTGDSTCVTVVPCNKYSGVV